MVQVFVNNFMINIIMEQKSLFINAIKKNKMKKPDIIIVDDHQIFRQGIKSIITLENIATVIGEASNGDEFLKLLTYLKPDLVLLDIDMPVMNGMVASEKALELMPDLKIIAFTMFGDEEYFIRLIELGIVGYILKSSDISELEKAIKIIMKGEKYFSNQFTQNSNISSKKAEKKVHIKKNTGSGDLFPPWF